MSPEQLNNAPEWINEIKKLTGTTVDNVQNSPGWAQRFEKNLQAMGSKIEKQNKPLYSIVDGFPKLNHQPSDPMEEALQKAVLDARMSGDLNKAISLIQSANAPKEVQNQALEQSAEQIQANYEAGLRGSWPNRQAQIPRQQSESSRTPESGNTTLKNINNLSEGDALGALRNPKLTASLTTAMKTMQIVPNGSGGVPTEFLPSHTRIELASLALKISQKQNPIKFYNDFPGFRV